MNTDFRSPRTVVKRISALLSLIAMVATSSAGDAAASEQLKAWPTKPVKVVVGFGAGGTADVLARYLCEKLGKYNGQPFVIENRPGAGGNVGAGIVAQANPDGQQILLTPGSVLSMNPSLYSQVPFDAESFAPVSLVADMAVLLVVHAKHPARNVGDFVGAARAERGKIFFSSPGAGSSLHLSIELFQRVAGVAIEHLPYKSGGEALTAVLSGQATGMFTNPPVVMPQIKAGNLKALAVAGSARLPQLPEVVSTSEAGIQGFDISSWFGVMAPARTAPPIVQRLSTQIAAALREPDVQQRLVDLGVRPIGNGPREFAEFLRNDRAKWDSVIRAANIRLE